MNKWILISVSLLIFILAACGGKTDDVITPIEEEPIIEEIEIIGGEEEPVLEEEEVEEVEELPVYPFYAPLTGLGSEEELNHRIIAVMVNNAAQARPQSGLDHADMVYEILSEGAITRLVALYHSGNPDVIGPIRSLRPYLIDIATGFDAAFAHAGGSPEALNIVKNRGLASLDEIYNAGSSFYRVSFRQAPHNLYTNLELLRRGMERRSFRTNVNMPQLLFKGIKEEMEGVEVGWIQIEYHSTYKVAYEYDPETMLYTRFVRGVPHIDMETEQPLTTTNLFVIETTHRILDDVGRRAIDVMTEGKGYLFQRGKMQEVDWKRIDGVIRPLIDGKEVGLYPGVTWINVIPPAMETRVTYTDRKSEEG